MNDKIDGWRRVHVLAFCFTVVSPLHEALVYRRDVVKGD